MNLSIAYFEKIFEKLGKFSPDATIVILFHKHEPEGQKLISTLQIETKFLRAIKSLCDVAINDAKMRGKEMVIKNFRTSTHSPMSIIIAISETLLARMTINQTISDILKVFIDTNKLQFGMMITQNRFEIGQAKVKDCPLEEKNKALDSLWKNVCLNPDLRVELGFKSSSNVKLLMYGFEVSNKASIIPLYLILFYPSTQNFPNKDSVIQAFLENFVRLVGSMNLLDVLPG